VTNIHVQYAAPSKVDSDPTCFAEHSIVTGTVLVSGGSGFIAGYLIRQLIAEGWMVHTTVRNLAREDGLRRLLAVDNARLRVFAADLTQDAGWREAAAGCSHVAHVASPLSANVAKDPNDLIVPARDGALRALRAAKGAGVKRFVMTSSVAAIAYGRPRGEYTFTEADWTDVTHPESYAYVQSKTIAERAARDWVAAEGGDIEFCTVNPAMVFGPVWSGDFSPSIEVVKKLLEGSMPGCADLGWGIVDVRDVADMHVRALRAPGMAGERFIASGPFLKMADIARVLKERLGAEARKVPTRKLPDLLVRFSALFDPAIRQVIGELGKVKHFDTSHAKTVLGWTARPPEASIVDTARSLIDLGVVRI
jgi:dihydroflavonol-4-reductase